MWGDRGFADLAFTHWIGPDEKWIVFYFYWCTCEDNNCLKPTEPDALYLPGHQSQQPGIVEICLIRDSGKKYSVDIFELELGPRIPRPQFQSVEESTDPRHAVRWIR